MSAAEMREALEQAYTEGFRDGTYDSKDLPRSWKNSDTARFAASLPGEEGIMERVADALFAEIAAQAEQEGSMGWVSNTDGEWTIDGTFDGSALARAAIRAINGGKP